MTPDGCQWRAEQRPQSGAVVWEALSEVSPKGNKPGRLKGNRPHESDFQPGLVPSEEVFLKSVEMKLTR